jgi:hypothetical protein
MGPAGPQADTSAWDAKLADLDTRISVLESGSAVQSGEPGYDGMPADIPGLLMWLDATAI